MFLQPVRADKDMYEVAKVLGVKDLRVMQRYAHQNVESLRNTVETVGKFSQWKDESLHNWSGRQDLNLRPQRPER